MAAIATQITSLTIVYSIVYSGADQRKHQSSASLASVRGIHRWPVNSLHKWPVTRKMFPFDDVIMEFKFFAWSSLTRFVGLWAGIQPAGECVPETPRWRRIWQCGSLPFLCGIPIEGHVFITTIIKLMSLQPEVKLKKKITKGQMRWKRFIFHHCTTYLILSYWCCCYIDVSYLL